jgi:ribosomal protein L32E
MRINFISLLGIDCRVRRRFSGNRKMAKTGFRTDIKTR